MNGVAEHGHWEESAHAELAGRAGCAAAALRIILPTREQTWYLRACLHRGVSGRNAWRLWLEYMGDAKQALRHGHAGGKPLLPLLFRGLQQNSAEIGQDALPYLRAAYVTEQIRSDGYGAICSEVLATLRAAHLPVIVLTGAALAYTAYAEPVLRHAHDIDLLLREDDLPRAAAGLVERGYRSTSSHLADPAHVPLMHTSGLRVMLHAQLFRSPVYRVPAAEAWARARPAAVAGVPVHVLSPADQFVHACGQAACCASRESLQWVADAWHVVARYADLDWDLVLATVQRGRLALPLFVQCHYLASEIGVAVPSPVLQVLSSLAAHADGLACEAALHAARGGSHGGIRNLLRHAPDRRAQLRILRWLLLPSVSYLRAAERLPTSGPLPLWYVTRLARYVRRRVALSVPTVWR